MANKIIKNTLRHYYDSEPDVYESRVSISQVTPEVDKTKSISKMDDNELRKLLNRLRSEYEAESLIRDLKRNSGEKGSYENPLKVDTTTPVNQLYHDQIIKHADLNTIDKAKSISQMSDIELRNLINRLRNEREVESIIRDLKRNSGERDTYEEPFKVDTTTPVDQLYHEGIKGMKWGIRRFQNKDGTRTKLGKKRDQEKEDGVEDKYSADFKKSRQQMKTPTSKLSNSELKDLNNRLQLEKQYKDLTKKEMSPGKKFVVDFLAETGKKELKDFLNKQIKELKSKSGKKVAEKVVDEAVKNTAKKAGSSAADAIKKAAKETMSKKAAKKAWDSDLDKVMAEWLREQGMRNIRSGTKLL